MYTHTHIYIYIHTQMYKPDNELIRSKHVSVM